MTNPRTIIFLGTLATFGAFMGVLADFFSAWSPSTSAMDTAFSVGLESLRHLYQDKPRWTYVLGNYLGVYFLPLHTLGFFLVYQALKPANAKWAMAFLMLALYVTPIGVGLHGTLAFLGDIFQTQGTDFVNGIRDYWQPWAYSVVVVYAIVSVLILALILSGRSLYPRWAIVFSPITILALTTAVIALLPDSASGLKTFLSVTGLNLPLMVFFGLTTWVLLRSEKVSLAL